MSASILKSRNADPPLELTGQTLDSTPEGCNSVDGTLEFAKRAGSFGTTLEKIGLAVDEIVANAVGETTVTSITSIRKSPDERNRETASGDFVMTRSGPSSEEFHSSDSYCLKWKRRNGPDQFRLHGATRSKVIAPDAHSEETT